MTPFIKDADKDFNSCIAAALRARRAQVQMTYAELADQSGIPEVSLIRLFTEKRAVNFSQVASIAEALGTTVQEVVEEAERESMRRHGTPYGFAPPAGLSMVEDSIDVSDEELDRLPHAANNPGYGPEAEFDQ